LKRSHCLLLTALRRTIFKAHIAKELKPEI